MLKKTMLIFMVLISLSCFCEPAQAEDTANFGYVNVAEAILLHPTMKSFDAGAKRFRLDVVKGDKDKIRKENLEKLTKELAQANKELKKIEQQKIKEENAYTKSIQALSREKINSSATGEMSLEKYNEKRESIDLRFSKILRKIGTKEKSLQTRIAKLNQESEYVSHASLDETRKIFGLILDDVYEGTDVVAKFYKIPFVFNSSFEFARTTNNMAIDNPMPEFFNNLDYRLSEDPEGEITVAAGLKSWLDLKNNNLVSCDDPRLMRFVLKGGVNMTPAVIDFIYQKHKISKSHRDFMQDFYKKVMTSN